MSRRRGFTLLELLLASALASTVVLTALGVLMGMQSAHERAMARMEQSQELVRAREVIRRAVSSLAMSSAADTNAAATGPGIPAAIGTPNDFTRGRAPRLSIVDDPRFEGRTQRVELVVHTPPIDRGLAALLRDDRPARVAANTPGDARARGPRAQEVATPFGAGVPASGADVSAAGGRVARGAFEVRPFRTDDGRTRLDLWWVPSAVGLVDQAWGPTVPIDAAGAAPLVRGVTRAVWQVYRRREMLDSYAASWPDDLPAYVRLELETETGLFARWTFEVDYIVTRAESPGGPTIAPDDLDEVAPPPRDEAPPGAAPPSQAPPAEDES